MPSKERWFPCRTSSHPQQHLLLPPAARDEYPDAPSVATVAPDGICPSPEARPAGRADDEDDHGCRRVNRPSSEVRIRQYPGGKPRAARQLQQKCKEMRTYLNPTLLDRTKAFDTVNREELWKIM
nr:unnamed protein product [Spirometra erinaceieuropaei]